MFEQRVTRGRVPRHHDSERQRKACRLRVEPLEDRLVLSGDMVLRWNNIALAALRVGASDPLNAGRTMAIVQAAIYDAVNSIDQSYNPYLALIPAPSGASEDAAAAQAAHDALVSLFPAQALPLDLQLKESLQGIADGDAKTAGIMVGQIAAQNILTARANDGANKAVDYTPGTDPGNWQPTPPANAAPLHPEWGAVSPFCLQSGSQFRPPPPPALTSAEYTLAFNQVKDMGALDSTTRTADQTQAALFWQGIVAPNSTAVGQWNLIAQEVAVAKGNTMVQNARLLALLDLAMADAGIACWDAKFTYNFWRPITAIRAADSDGNPDTSPDANWTPLFPTPPFPSYPSGHSTVSGGSAKVLAAYFGSDAIPFTLSFEGLPGVTRSFDSFSAAEAEAGAARIWGGIHYSFDIAPGNAMGEAIGNYVVQNFLLPKGNSPRPPRNGSILFVGSGLPTAERVSAAPKEISGQAGSISGATLLPINAGQLGTTSNDLVSGPTSRTLSAAWHQTGQLPSYADAVDNVFSSAQRWQEPQDSVS